jgi:pyruvate/2-oxoglutarate dehydrogenase complex dihydrolipoamide dehydrogenase (E3) component
MEGIDQPIVVSLSNVLNGETPDIMKTVVIGGGATGCEVALHLADNGSPVTIVEKLPKLGVQIESITRKMILKRLKARNARIMTSVHVKGIVENGVLLDDESGAEQFLEAERVVIVIGNKAYDGLSEEIASMGIPVHQVGDCIEPRSAKAAIYEAAVIGRTI